MNPSLESYCVFEYLYRDAGNYKAYGNLLLQGGYEQDFVHRLLRTLQDGEFFIPEQVGVEPLQNTLYACAGGPTADDHAWHEFVALRPATTEEAEQRQCTLTVGEFLLRFSAVKVWG